MNKIRSLALSTVFVGLLVISSCSPEPNPHFKVGNPYYIDGIQYKPEIKPDYAEIGLASWYGDEFHAKLTSNGEIFKKGSISAAHKTLPLPSIVKITNMENGKTLKVRVNDRGPFVDGRIIDVSEEAARRLGFYEQGTAKVLVELDRKASLAALNSVKVKETDRRIVQNSYGDDAIQLASLEPKSIIGRNLEQVNKYYKNAGKESEMKKIDYQKQRELSEPEIVKTTKKRLMPTKVRNLARPKSLEVANVSKRKPKLSGSAKEEMTVNDKDSDIIDGKYFVQVASFKEMESAVEYSFKLDKSIPSKIKESEINGDKFFRVRLGGYTEKSKAIELLDKLKSNGHKDAYIITEET